FELQQAVIILKSDKGRGWIVEHRLRWRRPDRGCHRQKVIVAKRHAITAQFKVVAERRLTTEEVHVRRCVAIKTAQVAQHRPEPRAYEVALLSENGGEIAARIFQRAVVQRNAERHLRGFGWHLQVIEQSGEIRVSLLVVNDETGIYRYDLTGRACVDRIAVSANTVGTLIYGDFVAAGQQPRCGHARDTCANNRNFERP